MWRIVSIAGCTALCAGCVAPRPTNAYLRLYDEANRDERHGRHTEAAAMYGKAARESTWTRTHNQAVYREARELEVSGDREGALRLYLEIAESDPDGEMASRCLYYAGRMAWEDGDLETALSRLRRVIEEYHHKGLAPQAVRRAVQWSTERHGSDKAIEFLREM